MAFAINSAPFEPAISVRKQQSLNTTKRPLKGPTARGCQVLFISPPHPEVCTQSPPPPPSPAVHTRLGSHSSMEGHNSCSIAGTRHHRASPSRERSWGRGAWPCRGALGPGPRPLLLGKICSGKGRVGGEASFHSSLCAPDTGTIGDAPRPQGCWPSLSGAGLRAPRAAVLWEAAVPLCATVCVASSLPAPGRQGPHKGKVG